MKGKSMLERKTYGCRARASLLVCLAFVYSPLIRASDYLYLAREDSSHVDVLDAKTHLIHDIVPVGNTPRAAVLNRSHSRLYVPNSADNSLSIVDTKIGATEKIVPLAGSPYTLYRPENDSIVLVGIETTIAAVSTIVTVNTDDGIVTHSFTPMFLPQSVAVSPDGTTLYVVDNANCNLTAYDAQSDLPLRSVRVQCFGTGDMILSKDGTKLYLGGYSTVDVYDAATLSPLTGIPLLAGGTEILAIDDYGQHVYAAGSYAVSIIDTATGTLADTVSVGCAIESLAVSDDQRLLFGECIIGSAIGFEIFTVDLNSRTVIDTFLVGSYATSAHDFAGIPPADIYVANNTAASVSVVDTTSQLVAATIATGASPAGVVVSPDTQWLYVSNGADNTISVISLASRATVATIPVGLNPTGLAISADGERLYVANENDDTVSVIDPRIQSVVATLNVETNTKPRSLALTPDGKKLYVALSNWVFTDVFDTGTLAEITQVYCAQGAYSVAVSADGLYAYVTNGNNSNNVYQVSTSTDTVVSQWLAFPFITNGTPKEIAVSKDGKRVYVGSDIAATPSLYVTAMSTLDTSNGNILGVVGLDNGPTAIVPTPDGRLVYVAIQNPDEVSIVDASQNRVSRSITGFMGPSAIAQIVEPLPNLIFQGSFE
jgi:YVTN family beta-propeller protein